MSSVICTLFEGNYHHGVAVLVNSLCNNGYKGDIYAGYRGSLPKWCQKAVDNTSIVWSGCKTLQVNSEVSVHFLPLTTNYHFTNYKPDFMLDLWNGPAESASAIFYFDPDIVVTHTWTFFDEWVGYGVALCEDINSPLPENHPRRVAWRNYFDKEEIKLKFKEALYANGGFVGVSQVNQQFLELWKTIQERIAPLFGGLGKSSLEINNLAKIFKDYYYPFSKTDQDALNATAEAFNGNVSYVGQEAMGFKGGIALIPHALGVIKPWDAIFLKQLLLGYKPRLVDKVYWQVAQKGPIMVHTDFYVRRKIIVIKIAAFLGRFYCR